MDPDGFSEDGELTDGASTLVAEPENTPDGIDFAAVYGQSYRANGVIFDSAGIGGVITADADTPTTGSAT
jgi:hypothetical protein